MFCYNGITFETQLELRAYMFFHHYFICDDVLYRPHKVSWQDAGETIDYIPALYVSTRMLSFAVEVIDAQPLPESLAVYGVASVKLRMPILLMLLSENDILVNLLGSHSFTDHRQCVALNQYPTLFPGCHTVYHTFHNYLGDGSDMPLPGFRVGTSLQTHGITDVKQRIPKKMPPLS